MDAELTFRENWGAAHPGGANAVYADGSVRTAPFGLAPEAVKAYMTPADGDFVPE
jgi:prepilin-type processing-associated H-X9-DG protein